MLVCVRIVVAALVLGVFCTSSEGQSPSAIILVNGHSTALLRDFIVLSTEQNVTIECQLSGATPTGYQWIILGPIPFQNTERKFHHVFNLTGPYNIYVEVTDNLNGLRTATATIRAEEIIRGLQILPDKQYITLNETQIFEASVESGSHLSLNWMFTYQSSGHRDQYFVNNYATQSYTFSMEGTYRVQLVTSNNVSSQTLTRTVFVQTPLSGLHALFDKNRVTGTGEPLTVAAGEVIELKAESFGSAPSYQWNLLYDFSMVFAMNPCSSIYEVNSRTLGRNSDLSVMFYSLGLHRIILCASNFVMHSPIHVNVILEVLEPIGTGSLNVSPSTTILHNSRASFTVQLTGGSSVVYNWTVIDPSGSIVENVLSNSSFHFFFTDDGDYTVSVIAINEVSRSDLIQSVIYVQPRLCLPPLLTAVTLPLVQEQTRSRPFRLEVSATPNCTLFRIRYQWIVYPKQKGLDCSVKAARTNHVDMLDVTTVNPMIAIPERSLHLGTYCFRFEASLGSALSTVTYTVSIRESDLVATIKGGDSRLVGALQPLELDGSGSYDPDDKLGTVPGLSYLWFCRSAPGVSTGDTCEWAQDNGLFEEGFNCFVDGQMTDAVVTIAENTLQANRTYLFELQVTVGSRNSTAYQQACVTAGDPPKPPSISCMSCERYGTEEFIPSRRTELVVPYGCSSEASCDVPTFQWRLLNVTADDNPVRVFLDSQMTPTGTNRRNFVIHSDVLDSRTVYRFELTVTERNRDGVGFASLTLRPNAPPSGGTCDVSPRQGTTLSTQFTFTCTGWTDKDSPLLEYRFATGRQKNALRRDRTILYTGFRSQYIANSLPLGAKQNNYTIYVFVSIVDRFGGETEVDMNKEVVVEPLAGTSDTAAVEEAALNALERVENEFGDDPQRVTETCGSIMETVNWAADNDKARGEAVRDNRAKRAGLRRTCVEKLESQSVESAEDAARIGPVLVKATSKPEEFVNRTAQKAVLSTTEKIIDAVDQEGDTEDTEESVAQVLEVFSNIIVAGLESAVRDEDSSYAKVEERDEKDVEEVNKNIVNQVVSIGNVIAGNRVAGEQPAIVEAPQVTVIASKTDTADVGSETSSLVYRGIGFSLSSGFATELSNKTNSPEVLQSIYSFNTNPFYYSYSSKKTNSKVVGLVFKTTSKEAIQIDNLQQDSEIIVTLPRPSNRNLNVTDITVEPPNYTFLQLNLSALSSGGAVSIEVRLLNSYSLNSASTSSNSEVESESVEVHFVERERPTVSDVNAESLQLTLTLDMFSGATNVSHQNYTVFLLASSINVSTNQFIGLRSLHSQLGFKVSVRVFYSACLFWDEKEETFSSHGCQPTALTTFDSAVCRCNHLTSFAAGMFPAPNPIDFSLFVSLDIASNPIALVTLIVAYVIYIVAVVFARRADMKDERYVKEVPFCGPDGRFVYEISVQTGFWFGSGTTANVGIVLYAEDIGSPKRHLYRRGAFRRSSLDVFQIAFDERLGRIDKILIWHDNSGKSPSWNLNCIQVKDLQSGEASSFIVNDWLSVDSDTGLLDTEVPLATDDDLKSFSNVFSTQTSRGFSEKHVWFSVVERPARSRFTRVQRVTCCLCLFISFVTASAMWYGVAPEDKADFDLGFVSLSYQQIGISIMATAVTFPLNLLWITMFRKADPISAKQVNADNELNAISSSDGRYSDRTVASSPKRDDLELPLYSSSSHGKLCRQKKSTKTESSTSKKCRCRLPHFLVYVAYAGCFATCVAGSVVILIYGQQFGRTTALRWVATMFLSFFESVLFFEPVKVLVIAAFLALLIKPKSTTEDDVVYNAEVKHVEGTEMGEVKVLTNDDRTAARIRRQKHKHMMEVIWEIILYFIFLWLVIVIAYADRDERAFHMTRISEKLFDVHKSYSDIKTAGDLFQWANSTLVDGLYWDRWYNGDPVHHAGFVKDDIGKLLGGARLRQIRAKNASCAVVGEFANQIRQCYSQRKAGNEHGNFRVGWTGSGNTTDRPWRWSSSSDLDGIAYWGKLNVYSGNGYVQHLGDTRSQARTVLATLGDNLWIDRQTRAVFVEFTLYNANVNLFQSVTFLVEFPVTGGAVPSHQFLTIRLIRYISTLDALKMACEIMFIFFILLYTYRFYKEAHKTGMRTFMKFFWSWVDMCFLLLSYAAIIYAIYRIVAINDLLSRYSTSRSQFINFYPTVLANTSMQYVLAFLEFLVTIKVLKLFRFNRRMTILGLVLKAAAGEISSMILFLAALLWIFAQLGYLVLQENTEFRSLSAAVSTLISTALGEFDFYGWVGANRIVAPIMFFCFNLLVLFILLSVFVAILNISVNSVRQSLLEQSNDFEVLDFMLRRLRLWLGVKSKEIEKHEGNFAHGEPNSDIGKMTPKQHNYSEDSSTTAAELVVKDGTQNTDTSLEHDDSDSPLDTLSSKLDTILDLLDKISPNQSAQQIKQNTTQTTLTGSGTAYLKKEDSIAR